MNALEWVFTSVYSHMVCKFTTLYKTLFTITAMVWLLASRSSLVLYKNILNCFEKKSKIVLEIYHFIEKFSSQKSSIYATKEQKTEQKLLSFQGKAFLKNCISLELLRIF